MRPSEYIQKGWTKKWFARDRDEIKIRPEYGNAVMWCAIGAMMRAYRLTDITGDQYIRMERWIQNEIKDTSLATWNDNAKEVNIIIEMLQAAEKAVLDNVDN